MNESEFLPGITYKIKIPPTDCVYFVTINHDENTGEPLEIFINSKNMENFSWVIGLTRLISMIFKTRETETINKMINELESVFDPNGGYYRPNGIYMSSMLAEIAGLIKIHINRCKVLTKSLQ